MSSPPSDPRVRKSAPDAPPERMSVHLRRLLATQFTPDELRHLAAIMDAQRPGATARRRLSEASVEELAAMIVAGKRPTVGWWRRAA